MLRLTFLRFGGKRSIDPAARYRLTHKTTTGYTQEASSSNTLTFSPSVGDGSIATTQTTWPAAQAAATGLAVNATGTTATVFTGKNASNQWKIERPFLPFDTSALPDNATITSASLTLTVSGKQNSFDDGRDYLTLVSASPSSSTTLSSSDFDNLTTTELIASAERKDITSLATGSPATFTLSPSGLATISPTGTSYLALREGHDLENVAPTGASATLANGVTFAASESSGATSDPVLSVTYTLGGTPQSATLQDLTYTYDALGNITSIADVSDTNTQKTTTYVYDDLSRLLSEAITGSPVSGGNTTTTYTYNAIGNIATISPDPSTDIGTATYTYAGNTTADSYANPHAVTAITNSSTANTTTFTYDHNGNLTGDGTAVYAWDYANRLTTITPATGTPSTYSYDTGMARVSQTIGSWATLYPHPGYSITGTTSTTYLAGPLGNTASLDVTPTSTTLTFFHTDHLGSTSLTTDTSGILEELFDYTPYGARRLHEGTTTQVKTFLGEYSDPSGLSYLNARYYSPVQGRFISQDSAFWSGEYIALQLIDPQSWNSYSYARNNPIALLDSNGKFWSEAAQYAFGFANAYSSNNMFGWGRSSSDNAHFINGQMAGDKLAMVQGAYETVLGIDAIATGIAAVSGGGGLCASVAGCTIGGPAAALGGVGIAAGTVLSVHGGSVLGNAGNTVNNAIKAQKEVAERNNWGDYKTLNKHYRKHGQDFNGQYKDAEDYAKGAQEFFNRSFNDNNVLNKLDGDGMYRIYDPQTNTFGSYNSNGSTATFFKPKSGMAYWNKQAGKPL